MNNAVLLTELLGGMFALGVFLLVLGTYLTGKGIES
jgi:hypothetical protein